MKQVFLAFCILTAVVGFAGTCGNPDVTAHGTVHYVGVEGGCWQFSADNGTQYEILTAPPNMLTDGLTGVMEAVIDDVGTICMVGIPVHVCSFSGADTVNLVGTLHNLEIEGGCWVLNVGNKSYSPWSLDPRFYKDGVMVKVDGIVRDDMASDCMTGPVIQVVDYAFLGQCPGRCQRDYKACIRDCSDEVCLIACGDALDSCLNACP